jgi:hypothetical protein
VDAVPAQREEGTLYISIKYRTAIHSCYCGCGSKVATPLRPTGWQLIYDGDTVTLHPSIGNWGFPCRSHYWIRNGRALPAGDMTEAQIEKGRRRDRAAEDAYYGTTAKPQQPVVNELPKRRRGFWQWLSRRVGI